MDGHQRKILETAADAAVERALQARTGHVAEPQKREEERRQQAELRKPHEIELGVEFCFGLLIAFYQFGRELMGLPTNVPLGAGCWALAMLIVVRVLWIIPFTKRFAWWLKAPTSLLIFAIAVQLSSHTIQEAYRQQKAGEQMTPDTKLLLSAINALGGKSPEGRHTHVSFVDPVGLKVAGAPQWPFRPGDVPQVPISMWNSGEFYLKETANAGRVVLAAKDYALGNKMFDDFLRDPKYVSGGADVPPRDPASGTYGTYKGPTVAEKDITPLLQDEEALCAMARIKWQDDTGCYATDFCQCEWAEPAPANFNWHTCKSHTGTESKIACDGQP